MVAKDNGTEPHHDKWEWRIFWSEPNLPPEMFFRFCHAESEEDESAEKNADVYVLIPGNNMNIKLRENAVSYKIAVEKTTGLTAYQKKHSYDFPLAAVDFSFLTGIATNAPVASEKDFIDIVVKQIPHAKVVIAEKQRRIAKFKKMKAEFSTLIIGGKTFQTFCLESKSQKLLETVIGELNVGKGRVMDYTEFLTFLAPGNF